MYRLTLNVIAKTLFTSDVEALSDDMNHAISSGMRMMSRLTLPYSNIWEHLPIPVLREMHRSSEFLRETIAELVDRRRAEDDPPDDLLTMLLQAQRDGVEGVTDQQIHDETITLFLAGHETTAAWFAWILYLLHLHPEVEQRLVEELDSVLGGRTPGLDDFERLPYLEMVLSETLRLYPSVWMVVRRANGDYDLDGYPIDSRSVVLMPPWVIHRDPRWYPDPLRFDPERWTPEERAKRPRYSFFPFGGGPRLCVGEGFAWYETRMGVAVLLQRWKFRLCPDQEVVPAPLLSLRPRTGMRMRLEARA
jgi:cytochrome P450